LEAVSEVDEDVLRILGVIGTIGAYGKPVVGDFGVVTRRVMKGVCIH